MKTDSDPHGWRIAAFVVLLALALTAGAYTIHTKVHCDPRHPECMKIAPAPEHAAPTHQPTDAHDGATEQKVGTAKSGH